MKKLAAWLGTAHFASDLTPYILPMTSLRPGPTSDKEPSMAQYITLTADDGHTLDAYLALPAGKPTAGVVVLQEIFGVNSHIRSVTDRYAELGYAALAPALFDRSERRVELPYEALAAGKEHVMSIEPAKTMLDVTAAVKEMRKFGPVAIVGFCWGGSLAHAAAAHGIPDAAVAYYGGQVPDMLHLKPKVPAIYHFGGRDPFIPRAKVDEVAVGLPDNAVYVYDDAGHGFNCEARADYNESAASLAQTRTTAFLSINLS